MGSIIRFPEPKWRPLTANDLYLLMKYVDKTWWEIVKSYWGIKSVRINSCRNPIESERSPMYPYYNQKELREYIKAYIRKEVT